MTRVFELRRGSVLGFVALGCVALAPAVGGCSCRRTSEPAPEPVASAATSDAPPRRPDAAATVNVIPHQGALQKDPDSGHYIPTTPPPPVDSALLPPQPKREPDIDLDVNDPARDYVRRYVFGSRRYGDKTACTLYGASYDKGGERAVDVGDDPACANGSTAVRDTFLVDVGADRLRLADATDKTPLQLWPDGSAPGAPAKPVREYNDMKAWNSMLHSVLKDLELVPIRVQLYGRGTYPLVTLAGWRPQFGKATPASSLDGAAKKLCEATADEPLSFVAGIDRSTTLRVQCPGGKWRWDAF